MIRRRPSHFLALFALVLGLLGCQKGKESPTAAQGKQAGSVLALVAASTKDAVAEIAGQFTKETGIEVKISADDSSKLAQQIVNGAPADVFISANEKWADFVKEKGNAEASAKLLGNTLVIVAPKGNPAGVKSPADLGKAEVKKIALAGPTVPAGTYARQALKSAKVWDDVEKKVVPAENVRITLTFVERGEVEAGIVYATDAKISDKVETVYTFEPTSHDKIVYPLVLVKGKEANPAARKFYDYLQGGPATAVFQRHGFSRLGE